MSEESSEYWLPDDLSYEDWVNHIFDHPILDPQWWDQNEGSGFYQYWNLDADPARGLSYLTQLFQESAKLHPRFTDLQIDQGFEYLVSASCSQYMFLLRNDSLPWADRKACIDAIFIVYQDLFSVIYGNKIQHLDFSGTNPGPNFTCYMWWDVVPLHGDWDLIDGEAIDDAVLNLFERILTLDSLACQESALHGIGHWYYPPRERTMKIVERFLERPDISPEIRRYAERAAVAEVM